MSPDYMSMGKHLRKFRCQNLQINMFKDNYIQLQKLLEQLKEDEVQNPMDPSTHGMLHLLSRELGILIHNVKKDLEPINLVSLEPLGVRTGTTAERKEMGKDEVEDLIELNKKTESFFQDSAFHSNFLEAMLKLKEAANDKATLNNQ